MSRLTRVVVLMVMAFWGLAVMHCKLEVLPGFKFLKTCCFVESTESSPKHCEGDSCGDVEDGGYRMEEQSTSATEPVLGPAVIIAAVEPPRPEARPASRPPALPPPDLPKIWQFALRAALPPRAPSFLV